MRRAIIYLLTLILGFIFLNSLNSCVSTKDLAYFNNIKKDSIAQIQLQSIETIISKNDVGISVGNGHDRGLIQGRLNIG